MPRTIEVSLYQFDELSDSAKEKAREWWRTCNAGDDFFSEHVTDRAGEAAKILGISLDDWHWSGFWTQGSGAAFSGSYRYAKGAPAAIRKEFPGDPKLHAIADDLQNAQRRAFYRLTASCELQRGNNMRVNVEFGETYGTVSLSAERSIEDAMTDFAHWFYCELESAYEWENADEQVDETILANEYEFTADGARA